MIYNDLYQDPKRSITIDWDRMLSLEGNSAPYIQYMHARCRSILRKAAEEEAGLGRLHTADQTDNLALLAHPSEVAVIKQLGKLPEAVREAGVRYATFVIAEWCYETARTLAGFYRDCSVAKGRNAGASRRPVVFGCGNCAGARKWLGVARNPCAGSECRLPAKQCEGMRRNDKPVRLLRVASRCSRIGQFPKTCTSWHYSS